jgi:hypothetical protein
MTRTLAGLALLVAVLGIEACAGDDGGARTCTPGATQACACAGGLPGAQICEASGARWGPCDCGVGDADADADGDADGDATDEALPPEGDGSTDGPSLPRELIHGPPAGPDSCTECLPGVTREVEGGGTWVGGGWSPHGGEDRIAYALGGGVDCGSLTVRVDGFAPFTQFQPQDVADMYVEFVALYEGSHDDHSSTQSQINFLYPPCFTCPETENHYKMKVNNGLVSNCASTTDTPASGCAGHCGNGVQDCDETDIDTCDWDSANYTGPIFDPVNGTSYTFEVRWSPRGMVFHVAGDLGGAYDLSNTYPSYPNLCYTLPKVPNLGYLFLGRPHVAGGGYLDGPVFANVELWAYDCAVIDW